MVDFKFKPRAAVRNDAASPNALVVVEDYAGRTVDLRNYDALGAVDDERSAVCHKRNVAHIYVFLENGAGFLKVKVDARLQRNRVSEAFLLALQLGKFDSFKIQLIEFIVKRHVAVGAFDREGA